MKFHLPYLKGQIGFTLIELSIAMTLLALIAMTLYGAFFLGHRAVEKSQIRSAESQRARATADLLSGYIRSAYPYRASPQGPAILFNGRDNQLEFVSALSLAMGGRGMAKISIAWEGEGDGKGPLTLVEEVPMRGAAGGGYKNSVVLSQEVRNFRIEYLAPRTEEERWVEQWDGNEQKGLPRAVRLSHLGESGEEVQRVFPIMMSVLAP